ncbi:hypothetical protein Bbelb_052590 [Branchiostoma belcheri]|nr:hypothetical protein Bbelb_052590 [Branchiostoma belcheri]
MLSGRLVGPVQSVLEQVIQCMPKASVTTRCTCLCVLSTCKNVGKRRTSVRGEYCLCTESYRFGSTQTRRRTLSVCKTFSACGLRSVSTGDARAPYVPYERRTCEYGLTVKFPPAQRSYIVSTYNSPLGVQTTLLHLAKLCK